MKDHEQRTTLLLEQVTADLAPDIDRLVGGGITRGRSLQRRRRVRNALAAAAVVGVIGAATSALPQPAQDSGTGIEPAAPSSPTPTIDGPRRFGMDPAKTAWVLSSLLPAGEVAGRESGSDQVADETYREGRLRFDGGLVSVRGDWTGDDPESWCRVPRNQSCRALDDGAWIGSGTGAMSKEGDLRGAWAVLYTADGFAIRVDAFNFPGSPADEPIADRPVLTIPELTEIVTDPVWLDEQQ